jgi:hypothetical protein
MNALAWLETVLALVNKVETTIGQLPRFEGGKLLMPESQSAKVAAALLDPAEAANALVKAACQADPTLHSALTVAMFNTQNTDQRRLRAALQE